VNKDLRPKAKLLAPAGNMEKLKVATAFGADEIYFGLKSFSLRNFAGNFSLDDAQYALDYLHKKNKKGYITLNIYPFEYEYEELISTAQILEEMKADAFIVADLGVMWALKKAGIKTPIHISTQANTMSPQTICAYKELGATRVNLARELSLEQIISLQNGLCDIETEVFIHGAVCFSYSGRCSISDYLTGRRANRGECTHPCRWQYSIVEKERPEEFITAREDHRGLYLFNSKDLALFSYVPALIEAGVSSFKIEGRMKSIHYLGSVISLYRKIIDGKIISEEEALSQISKVMNRGYSQGFMKGSIEPDDYRFEKNNTEGKSKFKGLVIESFENTCYVDVRNKIIAGTEIEILTPNGELSFQTLPDTLIDKDNNEYKIINHGKILILPFSLKKYSMLRKNDSPTLC
jgi:U32 family peptidase